MKYLVFMPLVPWVVYTLYEDWKDAHKTRRQYSKSQFARKNMRHKGSAKLGLGRFLLMLGFVAVAP